MDPIAELDKRPDSASRKIIINLILDEGRLSGEMEALLEKMKSEGKLRLWDGLEESPTWKTSAVYTLKLDEESEQQEVDQFIFAAPVSKSMAASIS